MWVAVRRVKQIALPGWINWKKHPKITNHLNDLLDTFQNTGARELLWSEEGKAEWRDFYQSLSIHSSGMLGAIMARSDAHVLRLAMIYCVLDHCTLINPVHLRAAIAFWRYCERSAQWAFAEKTGNKMADRIFWALQHESNGMTRTEIRLEVFNNHCTNTTLDIALANLNDASLVQMSLERTPNNKKPTERWCVKSP